ncbi:hypothetical protein ACUHGC_07535 [Testudinibacter sp. P27/CKL/0425]
MNVKTLTLSPKYFIGNTVLHIAFLAMIYFGNDGLRYFGLFIIGFFAISEILFSFNLSNAKIIYSKVRVVYIFCLDIVVALFIAYLGHWIVASLQLIGGVFFVISAFSQFDEQK